MFSDTEFTAVVKRPLVSDFYELGVGDALPFIIGGWLLDSDRFIELEFELVIGEPETVNYVIPTDQPGPYMYAECLSTTDAIGTRAN